jgi:hypothetical protein
MVYDGEQVGESLIFQIEYNDSHHLVSSGIALISHSRKRIFYSKVETFFSFGSAACSFMGFNNNVGKVSGKGYRRA